MNKKIIALLLFPIASFANFDTWNEEPLKTKQGWTEEQLKARRDYTLKVLGEAGLPLPGSGIKLVPRAVLSLSEEMIKKGDQERQEMETQGYASVDTARPMELINFKQHAKLEFQQYQYVNSDTSTHLRHNIQDLKLAFEFKGIPRNPSFKSIGVVPMGGFSQEKGGWSGAVQFFDYKEFESCAYAVHNVKASGTAAELAIEDVQYLINNKPTLKTIKGNKSSGFVYKVEWYDDVNFHELECGNMKYSSDLNNSVISLANQIDAWQ